MDGESFIGCFLTPKVRLTLTEDFRSVIDSFINEREKDDNKDIISECKHDTGCKREVVKK